MKTPTPLELGVAFGAVIAIALLARRASAGSSSRPGGGTAPGSSSSDASRPSSASPPPARLLSSADMDRLFGPMPWTRVDGDESAIIIDPTWKSANLGAIEIPQLRGVQGAPSSGRVTFHRALGPRVRDLFAAWESAGLLSLVRTWDGSFSERRIRGRDTVSKHAYGAAFDINAAWNKLGAEPAPVGAEGTVIPLVALAQEHGFAWGGNFKGRKDAMHFEAFR